MKTITLLFEGNDDDDFINKQTNKQIKIKKRQKNGIKPIILL